MASDCSCTLDCTMFMLHFLFTRLPKHLLLSSPILLGFYLPILLLAHNRKSFWLFSLPPSYFYLPPSLIFSFLCFDYFLCQTTHTSAFFGAPSFCFSLFLISSLPFVCRYVMFNSFYNQVLVCTSLFVFLPVDENSEYIAQSRKK